MYGSLLRRRRCAITIGVALTLVFGSLSALTPALADPSGTVVLASGDSAYPQSVQVDAVSGGFVLYEDDANHLFVGDLGNGSARTLASNSFLESEDQGFVLYRPADGVGPSHWTNLTTNASGTAPAAWTAAAPNGGLYLTSSGGSIHLIEQDASTMATTDLGAVPVSDTGALILANADGAAVVDSNSATSGYFINFSSHARTTLGFGALASADRSDISCGSISDNALGCSGSDNGAVVRVPLDGSAPAVVARNQFTFTVAVTDTTTAWIQEGNAPYPLLSVTGGAAPVQRSLDQDAVAADGSSLYFETGNTPATAAIVSASDAGATATTEISLGAKPLAARSIAIGPGRVSWGDDSSTNQPLWNRSLTSSGGSVTAGSASLIADNATGPGLSVSGIRTGYVHAGSAAQTYVVTDGTTATTLPNDEILDDTIVSGRRASYLESVGSADDYAILDLGTGQLLDTTTTYGAHHTLGDHHEVGLWGNYYAFFKSDGSLWRKDLTSAAPAVQVAPALTGPLPQGFTGYVYEWGDWIAWSRTSNSAFSFASGIRNMRTLAAATSVPGVVGGASAAGATLTLDSGAAVLRPWTSASTISLPVSMTPHFSSPAVLDGDAMAWIDGDTGEPKAAPLGLSVQDQPRSLGPPIADAQVAVGSSWTFDLPTSAVLNSCSVSLTNPAGATVRTLNCESSASAVGEAIVTWDGRDSSNLQVPAGTYTWAVTASGTDGPLLTAAGTAGPVTGSVTVVGTSLYRATAPARLLDTRTGQGGPRPAANGTVHLQVLGRGGVPTAGVSAVVLNVTVTQPQKPGFITVFGDGTPRPTASNLNFLAGQSVPNLVIAPVGPDGKVSLYNGSAGTVQLVADVSGYYVNANPSGGGFTSLSPTRLLDSRSSLGGTRPGPLGTVHLQVLGRGGVPTSGVSAVVLNVTVTQPARPGYITVYGDGAPRQTASNLNFLPGQTVPNLVIAPVGPDGKVALYNGSAGTVQLVADVAGFFLSGTANQTGSFSALAPARLLDTRTSLGSARPAAHGIVHLQVLGRGGVPTSGVSAVVLNVTVTQPADPGFITVYADGAPRPTASNLNYLPRQTVPNLVIAPVGPDGKVAMYNGSAGTVQLVADVSGYFRS